MTSAPRRTAALMSVCVYRGVKGSRTEYRINEFEAEIVRSIYRCYVAGNGLRAITLALNGHPKRAALLREFFNGQRPIPPQGNSKTWSPSTVWTILKNKRYAGYVLFGKMRNKMALDGGSRRVRQKQQFFPAPHLCIIDTKLEAAASKRAKLMRDEYLANNGGEVAGGRPVSVRGRSFCYRG